MTVMASTIAKKEEEVSTSCRSTTAAPLTISPEIRTFQKDGWLIRATKSTMANAQALEE